ncbi:MAG: aminopeptidase P family protein [Desulfosarcina sp.]|nr:aminopeptidase P family protein [Desulfobacterales bacterium]
MTTPLHPQRIERLREALKTSGLDALLILIEANRRYLSGYTAEDGQFDETAGALLISDDHLLLATDSRYVLQAGKEAPGFEIICYPKGLLDELPARLADLNIRRLGFESVRMSVKQHLKLQEKILKAKGVSALVPQDSLVENLRACKDEQEIAATRKAVDCAETALRKLRQRLRPGMTESEIARMLDDLMRKAGADGPSFPTIAAAGTNSALPQAVPGEDRIKKGEPLLLDWGARVEGYCSDMSRTLIFGAPDDTFLECYHTVRKAQKAAIDAIRAGEACQAVDAVARTIIREAGFAGRFGHSLGHGTGLFVHEAPRLSPRSEDILQDGMLVTVEPGIYLPDWGGIRLENQVRVGTDRAVVLNTLDLEDFVLPA